MEHLPCSPPSHWGYGRSLAGAPSGQNRSPRPRGLKSIHSPNGCPFCSRSMLVINSGLVSRIVLATAKGASWAHERRAVEIQRQGYGAVAGIATPLQVQARSTGDTRRSATRNAMGWLWCDRCQHHSPLACAVAVIRWGATSSSDVLRASTLHGLRTQGRYAAASGLGWRARRV